LELTHEELLAKIVYYPDTIVFGEYYRALRAVVELHYPHKIPNWVPTKNEYICDGCTRIYPCPTIQAIQKELQ
jgi:hypothetical protein